MLYSEFLLSAKRFVKISNSINDGWVLKTCKDKVYLVKSSNQRLDSDLEDVKELNDSTVDLLPDNQSVDDPNLNWRKWEYHVVYSLSYQVPVLYFNVWHLSGQLLSLDELLDAVNPNFKDSISNNRWFTLTQHEHPYLLKPFFYFHPCHTEDFLSCFSGEQCNMLITWLSSVGQVIWLNLDSAYGKICYLDK